MQIRSTAPLTNVAACMEVLKRAMNRAEHLPGLVVLYGPSGWGKTMAATYVANHTRAYHVQANSVMTKKSLLGDILDEMGIAPGKTIPEMLNQVSKQLTDSLRPLILDEMDYLVDRGLVELVRDIYEKSQAAILLIGEEQLPAKLKRWERFHGRVLAWAPAQPASMEDAQHLANLYCDRVSVADDLLAHVVDLARGSARRISANLEEVSEFAAQNGLSTVNLDAFSGRLSTGEAPKRRVA